MPACKTLLIFLCALIYSSGIADGQPSITRERCDELLAKLTKDPWLASKEANALAWGESYVLFALLDLHAATGDRKYLDEFIRRADQILSHRDDRRNFKDASGEAHKRWSIASKYTMAEATLVDADGKPSIKLTSTASSNNNLTKVKITPTTDGFNIQIRNSFWKRRETYENLCIDASSPRYFAKVINSDTPLPKPPAGEGETDEHSLLIRAEAAGEKIGSPKEQSISLTPLWHAHVGYVGILYHPMLEFAATIKSDASLADYHPAADRFVAAAEESFADIAEYWRDGPGKDEGYYLGSKRGSANPYDGVGEPFNYLAKHACCQLILFKLTGKPEYRDRVLRIGMLFKNRLQTGANGAYVWKYWYEPITTGWKKEDNISDHYPSYEGYAAVEDVSHGTLDIAMVLALHREKMIFDDEDMKRFAATFLRNVVRDDGKGFTSRVDGSRGSPGLEDNTAVFGWLPLAEIDSKVYEICRKIYLDRGKDDLKSAARLLRWEKVVNPERQ